MMNLATTAQLKALHGILHKKGLLENKADMVEAFSNGRTRSSKDLTIDEARELMMSLDDTEGKIASLRSQDKGPMIRKMFAMAHEMGWIKNEVHINSMGLDMKKAYIDQGPVINFKIETKSDSSRLYDWVLKFGYLKKELRKYSYKELPKLVSQFDKVYSEYLSNKQNR